MRNFDHSVNVLLQAYLNDELEHRDCEACAVGNLLGKSDIWAKCFVTPDGRNTPQLIAKDDEVLTFMGIRKIKELEEAHPYYADEKRLAVNAIANSGYTITELARIEYGFETASEGNSADDYMFNGLMACVEILADIHGIDLSINPAKAAFVEHYELVTSK